MVENIISLLNCGNTSKEKLIEAINSLHYYLLEIINKETKDYIASIDYHFPTEKIGFLESVKHLLFY